MQREYRLYIEDMLNAALLLIELAEDLTIEELASDSARKDRILWDFTVIGEAVRNVPAEVRDANPHISWRKASDFRNRIVHGYANVHWGIVHHTIHKQMPPLVEYPRNLLDESSLPDGYMGIDRE